MGRSPLDVRHQMGHTTLHMTSHYASLTVQSLQKSYEKYSPLRAETGGSSEALGAGYWDEQQQIGGLAHSSKYGTFSVDEKVIYLFFQVRWYLSYKEGGLHDNNEGRTLGGHSC